MSTEKWINSKEYFIAYSIMINAAQHHGLCTYQEIAQAVGLPTSGSFMGSAIGGLIGEVSRNEIEQGRPMLSSIVVGVSSVPGDGYYTWAKDLGLLSDGQDQNTFWHSECQKVYELWKIPFHAHPHPLIGGRGREGGKENANYHSDTISAKNIPRDHLDDLITCARHMRSNPTQAESILWEKLRAKRLDGYKFRRQHIIPPFIVDFYCPAKKLIIEVDGTAHEHKQVYDQEREQYLLNLGYTILRFPNEHINDNLNQVSKMIKEHLI